MGHGDRSRPMRSRDRLEGSDGDLRARDLPQFLGRLLAFCRQPGLKAPSIEPDDPGLGGQPAPVQRPKWSESLVVTRPLAASRRSEATCAVARWTSFEDTVHEPVRKRLVAGEIPIPLHVGMDALHRLARVLGVDLINARS